MCLGVLGGCLCYVVNAWNMYNEVWLMKEYGEERYGFIKLIYMQIQLL